MRLLRFRIRTLMIAVSAIAIVVWAGIEVAKSIRRSRYYRQMAVQAKDHESREARIESMTMGALSHFIWNGNVNGRPVENYDKMVRSYRQNITFHGSRKEYFRALVAKYERTARYPWLPVDPDPLQPK